MFTGGLNNAPESEMAPRKSKPQHLCKFTAAIEWMERRSAT